MFTCDGGGRKLESHSRLSVWNVSCKCIYRWKHTVRTYMLRSRVLFLYTHTHILYKYNTHVYNIYIYYVYTNFMCTYGIDNVWKIARLKSKYSFTRGYTSVRFFSLVLFYTRNFEGWRQNKIITAHTGGAGDRYGWRYNVFACVHPRASVVVCHTCV